MMPTMYRVRNMTLQDIPACVELQKLAFPPPFSADLHWDPEHLQRHVEIFPSGQFVSEVEDTIVGSCSNTMILEEQWLRHAGWGETVGGPLLRSFDANGSTLYGLDITVHPDFRRVGIGKAFYEQRYLLVRKSNLVRYGTACRVPDYRSFATANAGIDVEEYVNRVVRGEATDRTLTPLLKMGLNFLGVIRDYMEDPESDNAAALLEWRP